MGHAYRLSLRAARMQLVVDAAGNDADILLYNGTRPALGAAVGGGNTLIAELTNPGPIGSVDEDGRLVFDAITGDSAANASGTPTWLRVLESGGQWVGDYDIPSFPPCTAGQPVDISNLAVADGST